MTALLVAVMLLIANGFFVAVEFALVATRRARIEEMAEAGDPRARAAVASVRDLSFMLSASQLGITLASLGLGYVAEPAVASFIERPLDWIAVPHNLVHPIALVLALTIVVFFHMVIGEMVPKNVAIAEPERTALWLALPMRGFTVLFRPVIWLLNTLANGGLRALRIEPTDELVTIATGDELAGMLSASRAEGLLDDVEHRLMTGALGFPARQVTSVMVPRDQVVSVAADARVEDVERVAAQERHSRLPVHGADLDELYGYVHAKDLLALPVEARDAALPGRIVRRMLTVPTDRTLMDLLLAMRRTRLHFAAVVDGAGRLAGIATLEDVLESLVGDIRNDAGSGDS
ncbi:MAG TPA: hemolysin family protein [Acidimicrobiales bacterium]|nr:hemolysin family protein [Acidimicrobiales bacterium]